MRILIVEDDHKIANAIKRGLEQEAYAVDVEYNGKSGLGAALDTSYDIIILDRMLPEFDGIEICKVLRQKGKNMPLIMLTAKGEVRDRIEGLNAGADDYLPKPFAFEELLARVRALLRRPKNLKDDKLIHGDLSLDRQAFVVERGGEEIQLSSKEFALLEYLMRNAGRILTKDNIIEHVWDYDADILPNTVEVYIGYLRNKIDRAFPKSPALIETARGFGYRLSDKSQDTRNNNQTNINIQ